MRVKEDPRRSVVNRSVREVVEAEVQKRRCVGMVVLEARVKSKGEEGSQNDFVRVCIRGGG